MPIVKLEVMVRCCGCTCPHFRTHSKVGMVGSYCLEGGFFMNSKQGKPFPYNCPIIKTKEG
jgi:hypothetical protein